MAGYWGGYNLGIGPIDVKMQIAIEIPTIYKGPIGWKWAQQEMSKYSSFLQKIKQCLTSSFP